MTVASQHFDEEQDPDPDPLSSEQLNPDLDPHKREKPDPGPDRIGITAMRIHNPDIKHPTECPCTAGMADRVHFWTGSRYSEGPETRMGMKHYAF